MNGDTAKLMLLSEIVHRENLTLLKGLLPEDIGNNVIGSFKEQFEKAWNTDFDEEQTENAIDSDNQCGKTSGIICQKCGSTNNRTFNSRENQGFRIRRRKCMDCGFKWNTEEIVTDKGCV